jgi:restriction system protein
MQRQAERDARARAAAQRQAAVAADRARRAYQRASAADQKERARLYAESRAAEVAALNEGLAADIAALDGLLRDTLAVNDFLDFESLKEAAPRPPFVPGALGVPELPPDPARFRPPVLSGAQKLLPGAKQRYAARFEAGRHQYEAALQGRQQREAERLGRLEQARAEHQRTIGAIEERLARQHAEVEAFKSAFEAGEPAAVVQYFALVLERSHYPEGFPQGFRLAYIPESRQFVIQYQLPGFGVVPAVAEYKYIKTGDRVTQKALPLRECQERYKRVVAAVTVRTLHEVFETDRSQIAETVVFNGHVDTINDATGKQEYPCLVIRDSNSPGLSSIRFGRWSRPERTSASSTNRGSTMSNSRTGRTGASSAGFFETLADRSRRQARGSTRLKSRSMNESLVVIKVTNLFTKMGLETRQTQPSRDGGVDCVAFDNRPIFGGKVIIQAKRYKNTVGVSAVRDLFGSVHNEGASKGILVTTSGFGRASFEFAKDKPLELLSGSNLLYLLKVHADVDAKIEPPEHWQDPRSDSGPAHWDEATATAPG